MNSFGRLFRINLFGESHGAGVGVLVDGVPPGLVLTEATLQPDLDARRPGQSPLVSQRNEPDVPTVLSGCYNGRTTGAPVAIWIANEDADSQPYEKAKNLPRPGHADWPNHVWSRGFHDPRGGGHSSGRLTAGLVAAGSIAQIILQPVGIQAAAHLHQVGAVAGPVDAHRAAGMLRLVPQSQVFTAHKSLEGEFAQVIDAARRARDSIGGVVEFAVDGVPVGLGDPWFAGMESALAQLLFAIPAVKGVEFGAGFDAAKMKGSQHNDGYANVKGQVMPTSNHAGGLLGGRTTGLPITGRVAVKPASSIAQPQHTVDLATGQDAVLELTGRHDACIALRAVPVVQAALRIAMADFVLLARSHGNLPGRPANSAADVPPEPTSSGSN
jgi:chorismate synthase